MINKIQCFGPINAVAWSPNGNLIAVGTLGGEITLLEWRTGHIEKLQIPGQVILNVAICNGEHLLAFTTRFGKAYLVKLPKLAVTKELDLFDVRMHEANAEALAFSPNGSLLWTGCDRYVRSWNLNTGQIADEFSLNARVNSLALSPNGETLATVDSSGVLSLRDPVTGKTRLSKQAHSGIAFSVAFSLDDRQIVTIGREDSTVKIWGSSSLTLIANFSGLEK
jgi:WD40 repeat protein